MGDQLQNIQEKVETQGQQNKEQERTIKEIVQRLERLENERTTGSGMWRSAGAQGDEDERGPAIILGGRSPDTEADKTLQLAKEFVRERALPLPMDDCFEPGKQRGYVVIPLSCMAGENTQAMTRRAIGAVEATRNRGSQ